MMDTVHWSWITSYQGLDKTLVFAGCLEPDMGGVVKHLAGPSKWLAG